MISLDEGVNLVWDALADSVGGEIYVKKIPSMKVVDIAKTISPNAKLEFVGIRPGEKIHEQMIGVEDAPYTFEYESYYKILPAIHDWYKDSERVKNGIRVSENFSYSSDNNNWWMTETELSKWVLENLD